MSTDEHLQSGPPRSLAADDGVYRGESPRKLVLRLAETRKVDLLSILSTLYSACAGLTALVGTCGALVLVALGVRGVVGAANRHGADFDFGVFLIVHGALAILIVWICAAALFVAGRSIAGRKRYWRCFLVACYLCLVLPFGPMLGVPTLVLLTRPGVKKTFASAPSRLLQSILGRKH